jgi:hypothetical protein
MPGVIVTADTVPGRTVLAGNPAAALRIAVLRPWQALSDRHRLDGGAAPAGKDGAGVVKAPRRVFWNSAHFVIQLP